MRALLGVALGAVLASCGALGCSQPASPVWAQLEQTILADVENGSALAAIESAVVAIDPALASTVGLVDTVIQDVITFLVDEGALPAAAKPHALELQTQIAMKVTHAR